MDHLIEEKKPSERFINKLFPFRSLDGFSSEKFFFLSVCVINLTRRFKVGSGLASTTKMWTRVEGHLSISKMTFYRRALGLENLSRARY
jgi:hypothetical protein